MPTEIEILNDVIERLEKARSLLGKRRFWQFWQPSQEKRDRKAHGILTNLLNDASLPSNMRPFIERVLDIGVRPTQANPDAAEVDLRNKLIGHIDEMNRDSKVSALTTALQFARLRKGLVSTRKS